MALQTTLLHNEPQNMLGQGNRDSEHVASVAVKAYCRIAEAWKLNNELSAELICISPRTWARMKKDQWAGKLSKDQLMRISGIVGLYKGLHLYFNDQLADEWIALNNTGSLFKGHKPIELMIEGGLPFILDTRNYVDGIRGGV